MAILLAALALLSACAELALVIPAPHAAAQLMQGCETKPPVGVCSPAAGAVLIRHTWRF